MILFWDKRDPHGHRSHSKGGLPVLSFINVPTLITLDYTPPPSEAASPLEEQCRAGE